ncbi:helix-turn-helix transcriptional regulator [Rubrivivax gelatinosus]|nr:helix-turn-helix transcriptional regulator [Rubrivivax gelatinosus]
MARTAVSAPEIPSPAALAGLVRAIHAAGVDDEAWPEVLDRLRRHFDAQAVTLVHHEFLGGGEVTLYESTTGGAGGLTEHAVPNPWFMSSCDYQPGRVMTGDELISTPALRRTDFYRDVLQPRGLLHLLCGVVDQRQRGAHVLAAYRAEQAPAFGASQKAELALLLEHVTLSMRSQWRWQEAHDLAHALLRLSDQDANPAILVSAEAEPLHTNPAGSRLLEGRLGLRVDGGRVVAANPLERRLLAETIARVAHEAPSPEATRPAVLTLAGAPDEPGIVVVVRPVGSVFRRHAGGTRGLAMLAVRGAQQRHDPASCVFARQFELTAAQARVSAQVFAGQSLATIARSLGLSENTVRSHLKQVFQKTDTHSQMELVHLHARVCTTLP